MKVMKIISVEIVYLVVTAVLVLGCSARRIPNQKDTNLAHQGDDGRNTQAEDTRETTEESFPSGSGVEVEALGASGSGAEEEEGSGNPTSGLPKFMGLPFPVGLRGPVTITPLEPNVNRQKSFKRPCFFCFPRGRLSRVEVTAPGGPYLMNGLHLAGFGDGYPNMGMGFPQQGGPVFPASMEFPEYGPGPVPGGPPPCCNEGPPCSCQGNQEESPMDFQEVSEVPPPGHPQPHPKVVADMHAGHKAVSAVQPQSIHKAINTNAKAAAFNKNTNKPLGQVTMKGVMDQPPKNSATGKVENKPSENHTNDKGKEGTKPSRVEEWVHI